MWPCRVLHRADEGGASAVWPAGTTPSSTFGNAIGCAWIKRVGYLSYSNRHADLLFELVSRRYQLKSTIVTTNKAFAEWGEVFPSAACVVFLVDRLMHRAEVVRIEGDSYRAKEAKDRETQRNAKRAAKAPAPARKGAR